MASDIIHRYAERVGYTPAEIEAFHDGGHRIRHVERLSWAAARYSILAEIPLGAHRSNLSLPRPPGR